MANSRDPSHAAFAAESQQLLESVSCATLRVGAGLVALFAFQDLAAYPGQLTFSLALRLGLVAWHLAMVRVTRSKRGRRHLAAVVIVTATLNALMISLMALVTGGAASLRYAALNIPMLFVALLFPWPAWWTAATCLAVIAAYVGTMLAAGAVSEIGVFVTHTFYLLTTAIAATTASVFRERLRWREFTSRSALAEALHQQREFTYRLSHELRTPVNVMIGYADMLRERLTDPDALTLAERIRAHGIWLERLVSDLLDLAKTQAGKLTVHPETIRAEEVVAQVTEGFRPVVERKGLHLRTHTPGPLPEVSTDRQRLVQILTNLIGNAVKFTDAGGIIIETRWVDNTGQHPLHHFTLLDGSAVPLGSGVLILVHDTGIGIPTGDLSRLAEDYLQVAGTAKTRGGTGLGLSISRDLTRLLGGRLAVESHVGTGTTFAVLLPAGGETLQAAA